jgi:hypothetical protein
MPFDVEVAISGSILGEHIAEPLADGLSRPSERPFSTGLPVTKRRAGRRSNRDGSSGVILRIGVGDHAITCALVPDIGRGNVRSRDRAGASKAEAEGGADGGISSSRDRFAARDRNLTPPLPPPNGTSARAEHFIDISTVASALPLDEADERVSKGAGRPLVPSPSERCCAERG